MEESENVQQASEAEGQDLDSAKMASLEAQITTLQDHIEYLLSRNVTAEKESEQLRKQLHGNEKEFNLVKAEKFEALAKVSELSTKLHEKDDEVKNLKTDVDMLGTQLAEASRAKNNALLKLDNLASREESFEYRKRMMEQETELLRGQIHHLEQRVVQQEAELVDATSTSRVVQLESQLQRMTDELAARDQVASRLRNQLKEEQLKLSKMEDKISTARENEMRTNLLHKKELDAQIRVLAIAEEKQKESEARAESYLAKMKELQAELAIKSIPGDAERKALNEINRLKDILSERDTLIGELEVKVQLLQSELDTLKQESIDQFMEKLFPSALTVSKNLQGDLSLTQIFEKYSDATEELNTVKCERDTLQIRNDGLKFELSEREAQMEEWQSRLAATECSAQQLRTENSKLLVELEEARSEAREQQRSVGQHVIDKGRLQQQNDDMRKQVIRLLKENGALRSGSNETYGEIDSLVEFAGIAELQHKNIELVLLVRELQSKTEAAERALENVQKVADCNEKMEELLDQVKRYQEREQQQSDMMQLLIRQRDHFEETSKAAQRSAEERVAELEKQMQQRDQAGSAQPGDAGGAQSAQEPMVLSPRNAPPVVRPPGYQQRSLSPQGGSPGGQRMMRPQQGGSPRFSPYNTPPSSKPFIDALQGRLKKTQDELDNTSKAFAQYRENSKGNMDMVVEQLEEMRTQLTDIRMENANLKAACQTGRDNVASLRGVMDSQQKQLDAMHRMRNLQDEIITKHEKSVVELNKEIVQTYAKLSHCEGQLERAEAEKRRLRVAESSARKECDALRASMANQNLVFLGAQELKASRQRADAEDTLVLSNQLQAALNENRDLKQKLDSSQQHLRDRIGHLEACLERERALLEGALAEKATALAESARAGEQLTHAQRDVLVLRAHRNPVSSTETQTDAREEPTEKIRQLQQSVQTLTESEQRATAEVQEMTSKLASAMDALASTQRLCTEIQQKLRASEELAESDRSAAKQRSEALESDLSVTREQLSVAREQLGRAEKQVETLRADCMRFSKNQAAAGAESHESIRNEVAALKEQLERSQESQQREKEQHKLDLQALSFTRKQVVGLEKTLTESKLKLVTAEDELAKLRSDFQSVQSVSSMVGETERGHVDELKKHNELLHEQLQKRGGQTELTEIVRCLKRERDAAQSRAELFESKAANMEMQLRSLEVRCSEMEEQVERRRAEDASQPMVLVPQSKYDELLKQTETMHALTDSSIVQRQTNVALAAELKELKPKLKATQDELESLRNRNNLFQEKIVAEETNLTQLNAEIRQLTERATVAEERVKELEGQMNSSQSELKTNIENLRGRALGQAQELQRKNLELRKLVSEKEALLKQSAADKESAARSAEELTKEKAAAAELNSEIQRLKSSLEGAEKEAAKVEELTNNVKQAKEEVVKKETEFSKVRAIAKKYKDKCDQLTAEAKAKAEEGAEAKVKQLEASIAETQTRLAEAETKLADAETEMQKLQETVNELTKQVEEKTATLTKEQATNNERQTRMKSVISTARNRIQELTGLNSTLKTENAELKSKVNEAQPSTQVEVAQQAPATANAEQEELINQLRKELAELKAQMEQTKQKDSLASKPTAGSSGSTPSVKIRPMSAQARQSKPQTAQSAAVIPTTRAAPTARLRPMVNPPRNVAVLAPSPQEVPSTSVTPMRTRPREDPASESTFEEPPPNVLLVRPNEVHPQPSTSAAASAGPSTSATPSSRPPLLKRARQPETETQEPQAKQACSLASTEETEEQTEEEEANLNAEAPTEEVESGIDAEAGDEDAIDEELEQMAMQAVEDNEDGDEPLADEPQAMQEQPPPGGPDDILGAEQQQQQAAAEADRNDAAVPPPNFMLPLMQQGYEEVGDFGIVPSTPTLCLPHRQSGFGEVVSSPHVPQGRHFTFATESALVAQLVAGAGGNVDPDEATSGHMVPGTPLASSPNEIHQSERAESGADDSNQQVASSSGNDFSAPVLIQEPPTPSASVPRGMPSSRRNEGSRIARPTPTRPEPIVWNPSEPERGLLHSGGPSGRARGRARGRPAPRRGR